MASLALELSLPEASSSYSCPTTGFCLWEAGAPTELARQVYTQGDCWVLAWHVGRELERAGAFGGLAMLGASCSWRHAVAKTSSGLYLDVEGAWRKHELQAHWVKNLVPIPERFTGSLETFQKYLQTGFRWRCTSGAAAAVAERLVAAHLEEERTTERLRS